MIGAPLPAFTGTGSTRIWLACGATDIDRTCALNGCEYEWGVHVALFAEKAELTPEQVAATVHESADAPCWTAAEKTLIAAADALHDRAGLDGAEFDTLRSHYADAQILEIIQLCGFYRTIACLVRSLDLPLEPGGSRFPVESSERRFESVTTERF